MPQAARRRYLHLACAHFARELVLNDGFARLNSSELAAALRWSLDELRWPIGSESALLLTPHVSKWYTKSWNSSRSIEAAVYTYHSAYVCYCKIEIVCTYSSEFHWLSKSRSADDAVRYGENLGVLQGSEQGKLLLSRFWFIRMNQHGIDRCWEHRP